MKSAGFFRREFIRSSGVQKFRSADECAACIFPIKVQSSKFKVQGSTLHLAPTHQLTNSLQIPTHYIQPFNQITQSFNKS